MFVEGFFVNLDLGTLTTMLQQWLQCLAVISVGNQSYSMAGRTFTRANAPEVKSIIGEIATAIALKNGSLTRTVYSDMSCL